MAKVYRFELEGEHITSGLRFMSTMHYQTDVAISLDEPSAAFLLDKILNHYSSSGHNLSKWTIVMKSQLRLVRAVLREELAPSSTDLPAVAEESLNLPGTNGSVTGDQLPVAMAIWVKLTTGVASRSARGGTHFPPPLDPSYLTATGQWDPTTIGPAGYGLLGAAIIDDIENIDGGTDLYPVIYSRTRRARDLDPFTFKMTAQSVSSRPRWLRRRDQAP